MAKDLRIFTIYWDPNCYDRTQVEATRNPEKVDFDYFQNLTNGFEVHEIREVDHLDISETVRLGQGDIIVTRLFDARDVDQELQDAAEDVKRTILLHISKQVDLRATVLSDRLFENDSDYRVDGLLNLIKDFRLLFDYVNRDILTLGEDFDLALNAIHDMRVLTDCLEYWMRQLNGLITETLNMAVNHNVEYDDITNYADILVVVARCYTCHGIIADHSEELK
jgi:hypothetical protein